MGRTRGLVSETYKDCLVYRCVKNTKKFYTKHGQKVEAEPGGNVNRAMKNGTGGILVIDVDGKNGGSIKSLSRLLPELPRTMTVTTVSPNSYHLVYKIPRGFQIRRGLQLVQGVEISTWAILPGSVVKDASGTRREYKLLDDQVAVEATEEMLAVIEKQEKEYIEDTVPLTDEELYEIEDPAAESLLQRFKNATPGMRNEVYLQVALPILRQLGSDQGAHALIEAYPGDDEEWIHQAVKRSVEKLDGNHRVSEVIVHKSQKRDKLLKSIHLNALVGKWENGRTGTLDRRIFTFITGSAISTNEYYVDIATGTLAIATGTQPHRVRESIQRLIEQGRLLKPFPDEGTTYAIVCCTQVRNLSKGDNYVELSPYNLNRNIGLLQPSNPVWLSEGLDGRHSHVMAVIALTEGATPSDVARLTGLNRSTVSRTIQQLEAAGLVKDMATTDDAEAIAQQLANSGGGYQRKDKIKETVEKDLQRRDAMLEKRYAEEMEKINIANLPRQLNEQALWDQIG